MQDANCVEIQEDALNRLLLERPKSVSLHIQMADAHRRAGRESPARYHYQTALRLAESQESTDASADELAMATRTLGEMDAQLGQRRQTLLAERDLPPEKWSARLRQSLEIGAGERKLYRSEPTEFDYVGLPSIQYFDTAQFDWVRAIEAATPAILEELETELRRGTDEFRAYVDSHTVVPEANAGLKGKKDWSILPICERGWVTTSLVQRFPVTWETVRQAPLPGIYGWGPTVVFSLLKAGARIPAHNGMYNIRLICHLPLIVPRGCRFRVGNEVREWEVGKLMIFDDTIEHEAWNDSDEDRVVLIFDIWRPELTEQEREELIALFSA
jgi:aspartyl/asparaginyl beta-hydroxylase (cupin superfamily)